MKFVDEAGIYKGASRAQQIATLCRFLSDALGADPNMVAASEAVDGLEALASGLAEDLHNIAEAAA
jgi:hypothetical protein